VGVAVSGGADSVALLRLVLELRHELGVVLSVVHFNHKIRGQEADADQEFVAQLARQFALEMHACSGDTRAQAANEHLSLETAARRLRYQYFETLIRSGEVKKIATAHTLDDQAETVLLKLLRGAWTRGLAGIYPELQVESAGELRSPGQAGAPVPTQNGEERAGGAIIRPLLTFRRSEILEYLQQIGQDWREDRSNLDLQHTRNRVRHQLLPALEKEFNPRIRELLAEMAEIARGEEEYWSAEVKRLLPRVWCAGQQSEGTLDANVLLEQDGAMQRRLVRRAVEMLGLKLEFRDVEAILNLAAAVSTRKIELDGGWKVQREKNQLRVLRCSDRPQTANYEYRLLVPGGVVVPELGTRFEARVCDAASRQNAGDLLSAKLLPKSLTVRNWRPGDRFWPAHRKEPKKIKELLQERKVPQEQRRSWPVVVGGEEIVWLRGFASPEHLLASVGETGVLIQEFTLQET
jgi:tRNA(Ile)-lysidine synthase